ncbi:hypothetical protein POM88_000757 [Heracleum sosnowskyi]|uniref:PGG domain-containing protein n=1 Tax=Heracleum sosnowskyi TaxID=360622 RepID=A0AAD8JBA1_9APIA|nr:hypothetical protein POM88_000757 [Heracleum sosnowskyi]
MNHMDSKLYDAIIKDDICLLEKLSIGLQRTPTKNTVLHLACQYGSMKCVKQILRVHESLLLELNSREETVLHLAARQGHFEVVVELIQTAKFSLLQPNYLQYTTSTLLETFIRTDNVEHETALHAAVRYNHNNVVQVLVKEDPSQPQRQNVHKESPIYMASIRCYSDIIRTILDNCKLPSFSGPNQRTTLRAMFVLQLNNAKIRRKLCKAKVRNHRYLWDTQKGPGGVTPKEDTRPFTQAVNSLKKLVNTHMIVSALIATVALTAGLTIPGDTSIQTDWELLIADMKTTVLQATALQFA